MADYQAKNIK